MTDFYLYSHRNLTKNLIFLLILLNKICINLLYQNNKQSTN